MDRKDFAVVWLVCDLIVFRIMASWLIVCCKRAAGGFSDVSGIIEKELSLIDRA